MLNIQDKLEEVIARSEAREIVNESPSAQILELISFRTFNNLHITAIRNFQKIVFEKFNVNLVVVGGSYGCTKITFRLDNVSPDEARSIIQKLLENEAFTEATLDVGFEIAIARNPDIRVNLKNRKIESLSNNQGVLLFCSYSHKDEEHRESLEKHLSALKREGFIKLFHDRSIMAGNEWEDVIEENLERAKVILLLISADFISSDYCYGKEMNRALELHQSGEAKVVPIIVRPVDWQSTPFAKLKAIPTEGKAITLWDNRDEAWTLVAKEIRNIILEIYNPKVFKSTALKN